MNDIATVQQDTGTALSVPTANPVLTAILAHASNPNMDANKMEVLVRMHREEEDRQRAHALEDRQRDAKLAYQRAMNEVQRDLPPIVRDAANAQTKSRYAKLETIIETVMPIATSHGFTLTFRQVPPEEAKNVRMECTVSHTDGLDGYSEVYSLECRIDNIGINGNVNKTEIHGFASAMTYLRRYLTTMIFNIATPDDDGNAAGRRTQTITGPTLNAWVEDRAQALEGETNAWKWMNLLMAAFAEAPSLRDLDALVGLPNVLATRRAAPDEACAKIDAAFNAAAARLRQPPPKKPSPEPAASVDTARPDPKTEPPHQPAASGYQTDADLDPTQHGQGTGFEQMMIDADGEPKDRLYDDPFQFASDFMVAWRDGNADQRLALAEFNADALDEARVLDRRADDMLAAMDAPVEQKVKPTIALVVPQVERGKTNWVKYVKAFKEALDRLDPAHVMGWLTASRDTLASMPVGGQRVLAIQAAATRLGAVNVTPPPWLADMMRPATVKDAAASVSTSADERWVDHTIEDLAAIDTDKAFQTLVRADAVQHRMSRLQRDNRALFDRADAAFLAKHKALQAGARA